MAAATKPTATATTTAAVTAAGASGASAGSIPTRYYLMKTGSHTGFADARRTSVWAIAKRKSTHQWGQSTLSSAAGAGAADASAAKEEAHDILMEANKSGRVVLIFSVDGSRKYHGTAEMVRPTELIPQPAAATATVDSKAAESAYHPSFRIKWLRAYPADGVSGLSFQLTRELMADPNATPTPAPAPAPAPAASTKGGAAKKSGGSGDAGGGEDRHKNVVGSINMARNCQEIAPVSALALTRLLDADVTRADGERESARMNEAKALVEAGERAFFRSDSNHPITLLQAYVGSRRYNLHRADSDLDFLVVYACPTDVVLGLGAGSALAVTKNPELIKPDITIIEVAHFCQLLRAGDARIVECLFLSSANGGTGDTAASLSAAGAVLQHNAQHQTVCYETAEWRVLCAERRGFLTLDLVDKYLGDATGVKGMKRLRKWNIAAPTAGDTNPDTQKKYADEITKRNKLFYIVFRLLCLAESVLDGAGSGAGGAYNSESESDDPSIPASQLPGGGRGSEFSVWFGTGSERRAFIMDIRAGGRYSYEELMRRAEATITRIESRMTSAATDLPSHLPALTDSFLNDWLIAVRHLFFFYPRPQLLTRLHTHSVTPPAQSAAGSSGGGPELTPRRVSPAATAMAAAAAGHQSDTKSNNPALVFPLSAQQQNAIIRMVRDFDTHPMFYETQLPPPPPGLMHQREQNRSATPAEAAVAAAAAAPATYTPSFPPVSWTLLSGPGTTPVAASSSGAAPSFTDAKQSPRIASDDRKAALHDSMDAKSVASTGGAATASASSGKDGAPPAPRASSVDAAVAATGCSPAVLAAFGSHYASASMASTFPSHHAASAAHKRSASSSSLHGAVNAAAAPPSPHPSLSLAASGSHSAAWFLHATPQQQQFRQHGLSQSHKYSAPATPIVSITPTPTSASAAANAQSTSLAPPSQAAGAKGLSNSSSSPALSGLSGANGPNSAPPSPPLLPTSLVTVTPPVSNNTKSGAPPRHPANNSPPMAAIAVTAVASNQSATASNLPVPLSPSPSAMPAVAAAGQFPFASRPFREQLSSPITPMGGAGSSFSFSLTGNGSGNTTGGTGGGYDVEHDAAVADGSGQSVSFPHATDECRLMCVSVYQPTYFVFWESTVRHLNAMNGAKASSGDTKGGSPGPSAGAGASAPAASGVQYPVDHNAPLEVIVIYIAPVESLVRSSVDAVRDELVTKEATRKAQKLAKTAAAAAAATATTPSGAKPPPGSGKPAKDSKNDSKSKPAAAPAKDNKSESGASEDGAGNADEQIFLHATPFIPIHAVQIPSAASGVGGGSGSSTAVSAAAARSNVFGVCSVGLGPLSKAQYVYKTVQNASAGAAAVPIASASGATASSTPAQTGAVAVTSGSTASSGGLRVRYIEVRDFLAALTRGEPYAVDVLMQSDGSILFESTDWLDLRSSLPHVSAFYQTGSFVKRAVGHATGLLSEVAHSSKPLTESDRRSKLALAYYRFACARELLDAGAAGPAANSFLVPATHAASPYAADEKDDGVSAIRRSVKDLESDLSALHSVLTGVAETSSAAATKTDSKSRASAGSNNGGIFAAFDGLSDRAKNADRKAPPPKAAKGGGGKAATAPAVVESKSVVLPAALDSAVVTSVDQWIQQTRLPLASPALMMGVGRERADFMPRELDLRATDSSKLRAVLAKLHLKLDPANVLFVCKSGSAMYDLATVTSDEDYYVVFATPTAQLFSLRPPASLLDQHTDPPIGNDKSKVVEYTAREAGLFVEEVLKSNPTNVEPLFADRYVYASPLWNALRAQRASLISERLIGQYFGWITDRLQTAASPKSKELNRQFKVLYHAFHKIFELNRILSGVVPAVRSQGIEREFILKIRNTKPTAAAAATTPASAVAAASTSTITADTKIEDVPFTFAALHRYGTELYEQARQRYRLYRRARAQADIGTAATTDENGSHVWPEEPNARVLTEWLLKVRTVYQ